MVVVVDVQSFKTSKKCFSPKELAIYNGKQMAHFVFKPPFPWSSLDNEFQRQANWVTHNHHGIKWESGHTPSHLFPLILRHLISPSDHVYVKGKEKADIIRKALSRDVIEVEEEPALPSLEPNCYYHIRSPCHCALSNVYYIYNTYVMQ
uniref:Uncharacterized protein n=1 Tax=Photinus pyralis TaxID=7054 RepID=A0A1Y1LTA4_PHOPY